MWQHRAGVREGACDIQKVAKKNEQYKNLCSVAAFHFDEVFWDVPVGSEGFFGGFAFCENPPSH